LRVFNGFAANCRTSRKALKTLGKTAFWDLRRGDVGRHVVGEKSAVGGLDHNGDIIAADVDGVAPVGTGPFKFISRAAQQNLVLERFADYWGEGAKVDKVTYQIYENAEALVMRTQERRGGHLRPPDRHAGKPAHREL